jgi:hypothetical protein
MHIAILTTFVIAAGVAHAAVSRTPIKSRVDLKPGQAYTVTIESSTPVEIGWMAVQAKACSVNCVQATDLNPTSHVSLATASTLSFKYQPENGKVSAEFKNISTQLVTIDIYRVSRTCEAEACRFIDKDAKGRSLTFKIKEFKSITTSKDGSYSTISAVALSGRPFTVRVVWWTEDPKGFRFGCEKWIKGWLDAHAAPDKYAPYVLDGEVAGDDNHLVVRHVDSCVPHAPNFGALHVFN